MLDINLIRKDPDFVSERLAVRGLQVDFSEFLEKDKQRRELIHATEQLKAERNKTSAEIPKLKKEGKTEQKKKVIVMYYTQVLKGGQETMSI